MSKDNFFGPDSRLVKWFNDRDVVLKELQNEDINLTEEQARKVVKYLCEGINLTFNHPVNLKGAFSVTMLNTRGTTEFLDGDIAYKNRFEFDMDGINSDLVTKVVLPTLDMSTSNEPAETTITIVPFAMLRKSLGK